MSTTTIARPSPARERLLATASRIFYREGIHAVGVDRIVAEAGVTRATFYRHFPGKEDLVLAYLQREDDAIRGYFTNAAPKAKGSDHMLELIIEGIATDVARSHTRGCPFINAAAEYPDPKSTVRQTVKSHRAWFRQTLTSVLENAGKSDPDDRATALVLLRDAAMVGGYLDGVSTIRSVFVSSARVAAGLD